jgi:intracellular septation protein
MKLLLDFLPLLLFFATFKYADTKPEWAAAFASEHFGFLVQGGKVGPEEAPVLLATLVVIAATLLQVLVQKLRGKRIDLMLWVNLAIVVVLGGLTVWLHDPTFIKWKPTGYYWGMSIAFWASQNLFGRNLLKVLIGAELQMPEPVWRRLNWAWVIFFAALGVVNLWVAYHFSTSAWADFKVFGATGLMLVFMLAQGFYMSRHLEEVPAADGAKKADDAEG